MSLLQSCPIHTLIVDTTYCNPQVSLLEWWIFSHVITSQIKKELLLTIVLGFKQVRLSRIPWAWFVRASLLLVKACKASMLM
jgi:hypothetical protein